MRRHDILAGYFEGQADWRARKAREHPDDARNGWASDALLKLAAYVRTLPDEDERIRELATVGWEAYDLDEFSPGADASREISRFGFYGPIVDEHDYDAFLSELVPIVVADALEGAKLGDLLPDDPE